VVARHGLQVVPDFGFADAPAMDVVLVPGGIVTEPVSNRSTLAWLHGGWFFGSWGDRHELLN
jgi:transcriptional regulator GlxA family with amidase domain